MECERIQDLLSDFLDGSLADNGRAEVSAHLRECRGCAAAAEGLENTLRLLRNLPPEKAPPELLDRIRRETAGSAPAKPLWKKLFLPAHVKIPIEAAAAVLLFLLVYSVQKKEMQATTPPPPAARMEAAPPAMEKSKAPETDTGLRVAKRGDGKPPGRMAGAATRSESPRDAGEPSPPAATSPPSPAPHPQAAFPAVPAQRASTSAERIRPGTLPAEEKSGKNASPRLFAAPPSRLLRPVPQGREVTLEVDARDRAGLDERIAAAALRHGGNVIREPETGPAGMSVKGSVPDALRVRLPVDSAEPFLAELRDLGTIPTGEITGWTDLPAGPSPGTILYTVRIRVR